MFPSKIIRLWPRGSKKYRHFTIVVCYKATRNRGLILDRLGHFNPHKNERQLHLDTDRLAFWLNKGVFVHRSVYFLFSHLAIYCHGKQNKKQ